MWRGSGQIVNDIKSGRQHNSHRRMQKLSSHYHLKLYESDSYTISDYRCQHYQEPRKQIKSTIAFLPIIFLWHVQNQDFFTISDISPISCLPSVVLSPSTTLVAKLDLGTWRNLGKVLIILPQCLKWKAICQKKNRKLFLTEDFS